MSSEQFFLRSLRAEKSKVSQPRERTVELRQTAAASVSVHFAGNRLTWWSNSAAKRAFDLACVVPALLLVFPAFLLIGLAVRVTSSGPAFFLQTRMGCHGRAFTIFKFRTMLQHRDEVHHAITTEDDPRLTSVGRFLRRWKLDELPQLVNVLLGNMSLVGPRPKLPEHGAYELVCRPGITGAATIAFACEEIMLRRVPKHLLDIHYRTAILPVKLKLDAEYMARATFLTDLQLLVNTILRRWNTSILEPLTAAPAFDRYLGLLSPEVTTRDVVAMQICPPFTTLATSSSLADRGLMVDSGGDTDGVLNAAIGDSPSCRPGYGVGLVQEAGFPSA